MRLTDLEPRWSCTTTGRYGMGVTFDCPRGCGQRLGVFFANPIDGGAPAPADATPTMRWKRTGETFEGLTLSPSVDASISDGCIPGDDGKPTRHWHGFITKGEIT